MSDNLNDLHNLNELIKHEEVNEYGCTITKYSGKKLDYLISIAEELNEKCENRHERSLGRKFVKLDESCLRLDDEIWNEFRDYCIKLNHHWVGYYGYDSELCNTCESIIEEKVRKVFYPTQEEIDNNINYKSAC